MAYQCEVCNKRPRTGLSVSHSHKGSKRRFLPNLQRVKVQSPAGPVHQLVCTTCLRSNRIRKAA